MSRAAERFSRKLRPDCKVFLVTVAQNATPIREDFWRCLMQAKKHRRAELLVIPSRYKNPTSKWADENESNEWWASEVLPYLWSVRYNLHPGLTVLADSKVQMTAGQPLDQYESMTAARSAILGHGKIALKMVPGSLGARPKIITTTGACTVKNYTDTKAGKIAEFHHSYGAIVVEVDGDNFWLRHVNFDEKTKSFTDLDTRYYEDRVVGAPRPLALVMGDTHVASTSQEVDEATFGGDGIVAALRPRHLVWHDVFDGRSVNPHHKGKGRAFHARAKFLSGNALVRGEVEKTADFIADRTRGDMVSVIVPSNHNDFLSRWIDEEDWKGMPTNGGFYLETAKYMWDNTREVNGNTVYPDPFLYWLGKLPRTKALNDAGRLKLLDIDTPFPLGGVELGMHGHHGTGGSRGSIRNIRRIGTRSMIGHGHGPGIDEGAMQVGHSAQQKNEYAHGPQATAHCHGVLHADSKRQLVFIWDGAWRRGRVR